MNTVRIDGLHEADRRLQKAPQALSRTLEDPKVLQGIGTTLAASGKETISRGGRPPYKPLAESTKAKKGSSRPLVNNGTLRQSLDYEVQAGTLLLTSVDYLKYHHFQEGRTKARFPARPVWGIHPEDEEDIKDVIFAGVKRNL